MRLVNFKMLRCLTLLHALFLSCSYIICRNKYSSSIQSIRTLQILRSDQRSDIAKLVSNVSNDENPKYLNIMATKLISKYSTKRIINMCMTVFETLDSKGIADSYTHTALMTAFIK